MKLNDYKLWTALVTPLTPGLQIDFQSLESLIKEQDAAGNGLLILGSTGEALNLSLEQRKSIITFVTSLELKSPIMAGIGGHDLAAQKFWLSWLEGQKVDGYLLVTPHYSKPGCYGQYEWFKTLMDTSSRPCMLYNVPGRTGIDMNFMAVEKLKDHTNYWGIKEASGSAKKMKKYLAASDNKPVFCGDDALMPEFAKVGAFGLISVAANILPVETNKIVELSLKGSFDQTQMWSDAANSLFIASNPIPAKALLASEGRITSNEMMPPLSTRDFSELNKLQQSASNVRSWFKGL